MAFPSSPSNGQIYNSYVYNSSESVWNKIDPAKTFEIGYIHVQYPGKQTPSELGYYGTWTNISSQFAGDFFRAEGGEASAFESGEQLDQMQRLTGEFSRGANDGSFRSGQGIATGVFSPGSSKSGVVNSAAAAGQSILFDSANSPNARVSSTTAGETRPINRTIRIWERTA